MSGSRVRENWLVVLGGSLGKCWPYFLRPSISSLPGPGSVLASRPITITLAQNLFINAERRSPREGSPIILQMSGDLAKLEGEGAGDDPAQCYLCPPTGSEGKPTPFHIGLPFEEARIHRIYP